MGRHRFRRHSRLLLLRAICVGAPLVHLCLQGLATAKLWMRGRIERAESQNCCLAADTANPVVDHEGHDKVKERQVVVESQEMALALLLMEGAVNPRIAGAGRHASTLGSIEYTCHTREAAKALLARCDCIIQSDTTTSQGQTSTEHTFMLTGTCGK